MPALDAGTLIPLSITSSLNSTIGALEIGILVALFLSGAVTVQALLYFRRYQRDPVGLRLMVAVCYALDLGHTVAICHTIYTITVTQYGQPQLLIIPPKSLGASILLSGFIGPLEQGWLTYRLHRFTKTYTLPLLCLSLALARFAGIIALSTIALHGYPLPEYTAHGGWLIESIVIVSASLDVVLVALLCYYLSSWRLEKSRVAHKIVKHIMAWSVETGALTVVGALGLLITFLTMKNNFIYIGFFVVIPKLFSNSLLLSLNAREGYTELMRSQGRLSSIHPSRIRTMSLPSVHNSPSLEELNCPCGEPSGLNGPGGYYLERKINDDMRANKPRASSSGATSHVPNAEV